MKKILTVVIVLSLIISIVSCKIDNEPTSEKPNIEENKESIDEKNKNNIRVFVNGVEMSDDYYAEYDSNFNYVKLPLTVIIPMLGGSVKWNDAHTADIEIAGYSYVLDTQNDKLYLDGDSHMSSLIMPAPSSVAFFEMMFQEYVVSDNCLLLLFNEWGVTYRFDIENMTYTLTRE